MLIQKAATPDKRFENKAQMEGASKGPAVTAAILSTTSTIPPIAGTMRAMTIIQPPKNHDDQRAAFINRRSLAAGLIMDLYTSLVKTADTTFKVVLAVAEVEK